jgi:hypothetical protein
VGGGAEDQKGRNIGSIRLELRKMTRRGVYSTGKWEGEGIQKGERGGGGISYSLRVVMQIGEEIAPRH